MRSARLRRGGIAALVFASVFGATALAAGPSYAIGVTIPSTETLYSLPCNHWFTDAQLASVNSGSGQSTTIGGGNSSAGDCVWDAAWDAATGKAYFQEGDTNNTFYVLDPSTGSSQVAFTDPSYQGNVLTDDDFNAFTISPQGVAYAVVWIASLQGFQLVTVDLQTGDLTLVGADNPTSSLAGTPSDIFSIAFDPINDGLYGISRKSGTIYQFNLASGPGAGAATIVGVVDIGSTGVDGAGAYGLQFDSTGRMWFLNVSKNQESDLSSLTLPTDQTPVQPVDAGPLNVSGITLYSFALFLAPKATASPTPPAPRASTLASTGVDPVPGELAALLLVTLGSGAWAVSAAKRRRRV